MSRSNILLAAALSTAIPVDAAVTLRSDDGTLADRSQWIVEGRILSAEPAPGPAVAYRMRVSRALKGTPPAELIVRVLGGVGADGVGLAIVGAPRFDLGEEALLFLQPRADGTHEVTQLSAGAFHVAERDGRRVAVRPSAGTHELRPFGAAAAADGSRDLERFGRWLADRGAGRRRPADYFIGDDSVADSSVEDGASTPAKGAPAPADKFSRIVSSTDPPPLGCGENGGHALRWFVFDDGDGAVGWSTHLSGQNGLPLGGLGAVRAGLRAWTKDPNSIVDLRFSGVTDRDAGLGARDGFNTVLFGDPGDQIPGSFEGSGLLALGGPWFSCELMEHDGELFHPILEADIVTQDGIESFFNANPQAESAAAEIFGHELGHTLGFAHSGRHEALMFGLLHDDGRGAALDVDDFTALRSFYRVGQLRRPDAPSDLEVELSFDRFVRLTWSDNSDNESNFRLERLGGETAPDEFRLIGVADDDQTVFVDNRVAPETKYRYRIRAQNGAGASSYSPVVETTTPADPRPAAPTNLRAAPLSSTRIRLTWQDNSRDETSFNLLILDPSTSSFIEIPVAIPADTTTVKVVDLHPATRYTFKVKARNGLGSSRHSNAVSATTFEDDTGCTVSESELCLLDGRFKVELLFADPAPGGGERAATAIPSTDQTGLFWFFSPANIELIVKMLDGRGINGHFWMFYSGITDLEYQLRITDTETGRLAVYHNPAGELCGFADTTIFKSVGATASVATAGPADVDPSAIAVMVSDPTFDAPLKALPKAAGDCLSGSENLCLLDDRLRVEVDWKAHGDGGQEEGNGGQEEGAGQAVYGSDNSGFFWFFGPQNTELVVKALDGSRINGHLWFFYGALTDLEYEITVTDTVTGNRRVYYNPAGEICGRADIEAFPVPSPGS